MKRKIGLSGIKVMLCLALTVAPWSTGHAMEETPMVTVHSENHLYDQDGNEISVTVSEFDVKRLSDSLLRSITLDADNDQKSLIHYREDGTKSTVSFTISELMPKVTYSESNSEGEMLTLFFLTDWPIQLYLFDYEKDTNSNQSIMTIHRYENLGEKELSYEDQLDWLFESDETRFVQNTYDAEGRRTEQVQLSEDGEEQQRSLVTYEEVGDTVIQTTTTTSGAGSTQVTIRETVPLSSLPQEAVSDDELMEGIWIGKMDGMREEFLQSEDPGDFLYIQIAFLIDAENSQCLWYDGGEFLPVKWEQDGSGCILLNEDTTYGQIGGEYTLQYDADTDTILIYDLWDTEKQTLSLSRW